MFIKLTIYFIGLWLMLLGKISAKQMIPVLFLCLATILLIDNTYAASFSDITSLWEKIKSSGTATTVGTIFANLDGVFRVGIALTMSITKVIALWFAWRALLGAVKVSQGQETISSVVLTAVAAGLLFSFVQSIDAFSNTLGFGTAANGFNDSTITKACQTLIGAKCQDDGVMVVTTKAMMSIVSLFRLAGVIAMARGIMGIRELGLSKGQASGGKIVISILAGVLLYNIVPFAVKIANTASPNNGLNGISDLVVPTI